MAVEKPEAARAALPSVEQPIRAAEVVGALSLATDLGTGQPLEHALRTAVLAVRLGELAGASARGARRHVLRRAPPRLRLHVERARGGAAVRRRHRAPGRVLPDRPDQPGGGARVLPRERRGRPAAGGPRGDDRGGDRERRPEGARVVRDDVRGRAAVRRLARASARASRRRSSTSSRAGTDAASRTSRGDAIPLPMRLLHVARDISLFLSAAGPDEARAVDRAARGRRVRAPARRARRARTSTTLLAELDETRMWEQALEIEPFPQRLDRGRAGRRRLHGDRRAHRPQVAVAARALDGRGRARRGRRLAPGTARRRPSTLVRRAALAHDLGRVGVSNAIWEKPGPLGFGEWERVRLHPHFTERAFAQSPALAPIGLLAGSHHERLDGSGYHRGTRAPALDQAARILAAADCYAAMREARPYRPALDAAGGRGGAAARGRRGAARPGGRRRRARRGGPPRAASARASCRPG